MDNSKLKPYYIFGDHLIDAGAKEQFFDCLAADYSLRGALMADAHRGYSLPIGGVMWTEGVVVPAYVGYDIGCGMQAVRTSFRVEPIRSHAEGIYTDMKLLIPTGFSHHKDPISYMPMQMIREASPFVNDLTKTNAVDCQLGTMGGNNHYIEIGEDMHGYIWIVTHSGSRNLGHKVASHYMKIAGGGKCREGNYPLDMQSEDGVNYWKDMVFCLEFAEASRALLLNQVEDVLLRYGFSGEIIRDSRIDTVHNYAEYISSVGDQVMHRKGATRVHQDRNSIVAGNPVIGTFLVKGRKDRPISLDSVSHGMGRVGSRKQAKQDISKDQVDSEMKGVVGHIKQDEAPSAYKPVGAVMDAQSELLTIEDQIKPIICLKG